MKVIGHRGSMLYGFENTLKAFKQAKELGADWVEVDVEVTKDGVPVIMHDSTIDRTTTGTGKVADMTLKQIRRYKVEGEKIPTLAEVIEFLYEEGMGLDIEVKTKRAFEYVFKTIEGMKPKLPEMIISSFWHEEIREYKKMFPSYQMGYLYQSHPTADMIEKMLKEVDFLLPFFTYVDDIYERYADRVIPWPVDDPGEISRFYRMGVFAVITDIPDVADAIRKHKIPDMSQAVMRAIHLFVDLSTVKDREKDGQRVITFYIHNRLNTVYIRAICGQDVEVKTTPKLPAKVRYGDRMKVTLKVIGDKPAIYLDTRQFGLIRLDIEEIVRRAMAGKKRKNGKNSSKNGK